MFAGTRVPVQNLLDYLEGGKSIHEFLSDFPTVKLKQVLAVLEAMKHSILGPENARVA